VAVVTKSPLREIALLFLRLGTTAFGGPAAHIALMEDEVVTRRQWLSRAEFLDLLGATNLIPGPNSTEMAIHIGYKRGGWPGLLIAGVSFIIPAAVIVGLIAAAYVRYGKLPQTTALLYAVKPVVIAVVLQAIWRLGASALKNAVLIGICVAAIAASLLGVNELVVLAAGGVLAMSTLMTSRRHAMALLLLPAAASSTATAVGLAPLFLFFLKVGSVLFGSGYVLLAFLRNDLVLRWQWLSDVQLLDAIAVGQVTPGPVFTTATFIGYILAGPSGAVTATVGIFLPAFVFVALSGPLLRHIRKSAVLGAALDGVNAASLALMVVVTWQLGRAALIDLPTILIAIVSSVALIRYKVNSVWLIAAAAVLGLTGVLHGAGST
jgi:chromate transporter